MKVLIITGGNSSERTVSLTSAKNVQKALEENGHEVKQYDVQKGYKPIVKLAQSFDTIFPVIHGEEGEGGILHEFLSKIDKPIVGTRNYVGLKNGWYKIPFKQYCDKIGIKTPSWKIIKNKQDIINFGLPCVLKTSNGGSSREVTVVKDQVDLNSSDVKRILNIKAELFVEEYLNGIEVTVGMLNNKALPLIEIIPPAGEFFNYENKYTGKTQEIPFAPSLDKKIQKKIQKLTIEIHKHFNLGTYSRTDFMVYQNTPFVLDLNTIPGLTSESLLPKEAAAAGINFNKFVEILLNKAQ